MSAGSRASGDVTMPTSSARSESMREPGLRPELKQGLQRLAEADRRTLASFAEGLLEEWVAKHKSESGKPAGKRK